MHRNLEEWLEDLSNLCGETKYEAVRNGGKNSAAGIAIVPRGEKGPQRICVYPKKTKGAGFVVEMDVYRLAQKNCNLREYDGIREFDTCIDKKRYVRIEKCVFFMSNF